MPTSLVKSADGWYQPDSPRRYISVPVAPGEDAVKKAKAALQSNPAVRIVLTSGAVYPNLFWTVSGPSPETPLWVSTDGPDRAVIQPGPNAAWQQKGTGNFLVENLHCKATTGRRGIRPHDCFNTLYQNCLVENADQGFDIADGKNLHFYRIIGRDCWSPTPGNVSVGMYSLGTDDLTIEEPVFDICGWKPGNDMGTSNWAEKCHCIYLAETNTNVRLIRPVLSRGCSHGLQLRCGGTVDGGIFLDNPIHGFGQNVSSDIRNAYFQGSAPIGQGTSRYADVERGWGWTMQSRIGNAANLAFRGGGSTRTDAAAIRVADEDRVPPGTPDARLTRISGVVSYGWTIPYWAGANPGNVQSDIVLARRVKDPAFTIGPDVVRFRNLTRLDKWDIGERTTVAIDATQRIFSPEEVAAGKLREAAKSLNDAADVLEGLHG